jgi:proteasome lid subunit RPN8/RPN11
MSEAAAFETWGVEGAPITIEYSLVVLEEIRQEVSQGLMKFSRGGIEVGGVLYGTREGQQIRVQAIRPMVCEHAQGPSFQLSADDRAKLDAQLAADQQDPALQSLARLGWYVSHTRGELTLTESDVEIFSTYFRDPWQVTWVIRPARGTSMRAAFFVWESDGTVKATQSYKEFNFPDRLAGVMEATAARAERGEPRPESRIGFRPLPNIPDQSPLRAPRPAQMSVFEGSQYYPSPVPERKKWPWLVGGLAVLAVLAFLVLRFWPTKPAEGLGLLVVENQGQLEVQWNAGSRTIVRATKGSLTISDGTAIQQVPLSRSQLSDGRFLYIRRGGDVEVRIEVEGTEGNLRESSRFLGRPPVPQKSEETLQLESQRAALEQEVQTLKGQNAELNTRIQQLERTQRILESRIGITSK